MIQLRPNSSLRPLRNAQLRLAAITLGITAAALSAQSTQHDYRVLHTDGTTDSVTVRSISSSGLIALDTDRLPMLIAWDEFVLATRVGLEPATEQLLAGPAFEIVGWLELTDGQRLRAWPNPETPEDSEAFEILLSDGSPLSLPLEIVRSFVVWQPGEAQDLGQETDRVMLGNGDVLTGFIESVGLTIELDDQSIPLDRVAAFTIANPSTTPTSPLFALLDGSVLSGSQLQPAVGGRLSFQLALPPESMTSEPPEITISLEEIAELRSVASEFTPISLGSVELLGQSPLGGRRWSPPPSTSNTVSSLGLVDLTLPGSVELVYDLPRGASRLTTVAELTRGRWSDATLSIAIEQPGGSRQLLQQTDLGPGDRLPINLQLPEDAVRLVLLLEPGTHGPIQDELTLKQPILLVESR